MNRRAVLALALGMSFLAPARAERQRFLAPDDPNASAAWDWRDERPQDLHITRDDGDAPFLRRVRLPFRSPGNRLSQGPGQLHPEDGWMLVHRDKTLPLAWVPTVPGTEAIARSLDGSTYWHLQALGQR